MICSNEKDIRMSYMPGEPYARGYTKEYGEKHCNSKAFQDASDLLLKEVDRAIKDPNIKRVEEYITRNVIENNRVTPLLGFECCSQTCCDPHGQVFDLLGKVRYIDGELARKYNLRYGCPDSVAGEIKMALKPNYQSFTKRQIEKFNGIDFLIALKGHTSSVYEDSGCPVISPVILSQREYSEALTLQHGLSSIEHNESMHPTITNIFNENPEYYGDKDLGKEVRDIAYKREMVNYNPTGSRSAEWTTIMVGVSNNPYNRMPKSGESSDEFYTRIVRYISKRMNNPRPDRELDFLFLDPVSQPRLHITDKSISKYETDLSGKWFFSDDNITFRNNYLFTNEDNRVIIFRPEFVIKMKEIVGLEINSRIPIFQDFNKVIQRLTGMSPFPKILPSKNLPKEGCNFCTDFTINENHKTSKKRKNRVGSRKAMNGITGSKHNKNKGKYIGDKLFCLDTLNVNKKNV